MVLAVRFDGQWREDRRSGYGRYREWSVASSAYSPPPSPGRVALPRHPRGVFFSYEGQFQDDRPHDESRGRIESRRYMRARGAEVVLVPDMIAAMLEVTMTRFTVPD